MQLHLHGRRSITYLYLVKPRLTLLLILMAASLGCMAEGTKQINGDSLALPNIWIHNGDYNYSCFGTVACDDDQSLFIHIAHPGEKVYLGFRDWMLTSLSFSIKRNGIPVFNSTAFFTHGYPRYIKYYSQAIAGPNALSPHGYPAITFSPPPAGDYRIDFTLPASGNIGLRYFDITVVDTTQTDI